MGMVSVTALSLLASTFLVTVRRKLSELPSQRDVKSRAEGVAVM
jgi:hypothetical protein